MAKPIQIEELHLIQKLFKEGMTQDNIKTIVDIQRQKEGRYQGQGISTNTISKISPGSGYCSDYVAGITERSEKANVIRVIMRCMDCSEAKAKKVYKRNIVPLCPARFTDTNAASLISIRYYASACNDYLYVMFTTEDYATQFDDPDLADILTDVWTVRTSIEFREICTGEVGRDELQMELDMMADDRYIPQLVNVCVLKRA